MNRKAKDIVISKTPYRLILGDGTDLPPYVKKYGGHTLSATIDKYVTVVVRRRIDDRIVFHYALGTQEGRYWEEIEHPYVREVMKHIGASGGVDIASFTDVPFSSGLGSSGAFTVGLLNALWKLAGTKKGPRELAEEAAHIELNALQSPIGKHDQYLAAYGGVCDLRFQRNGSVKVKKIVLSARDKKKWEDYFLLVYSGMPRSASRVLAPVFGKLARGESAAIDAMHEFCRTGERMIGFLAERDFSHFSKAFDALWEIRKSTFGSSNERLDAMIAAGKKHGAISGAVCGAGGGGFLYFLCPNAKVKKRVTKALAQMGAPTYPFLFTEEGSRIIFSA